MSLNKWTASTLTALLLAASPAFADNDNDKDKDLDYSGSRTVMERYDFECAPGNVMVFRDPVSFTGEVTAVSDYDRTIRAANGMTIRIPNQGLVWNGDTQMFAQSTNLGDKVVVHMRQEEPYRIMQTPTSLSPWLAVGSYDGVFYLSNDFVADLDLDHLDNNIYAKMSPHEEDRTYDVDLASFDGDDDL